MSLPSDIRDLEARKFIDAGSNKTAVNIAQTNAFVKVPYDFISYTSGSTTDTYVYKTGGSGGTTVATLTITYTGTDKQTISTVAVV